jgi:type II secretory pathway pseudopilin PulG
VVIAIISLLSSAVLASLSGARESARDTRRATDFEQLRTALELYYNDNGNYARGEAGDEYDRVSKECTNSPLYNNLVGKGYLQEMITDPIDNVNSCKNAADNSKFYYGWDEINSGGRKCFSINRFGGGVPESLQAYNEQPDTNFGGDANLDQADFVYCFGN